MSLGKTRNSGRRRDSTKLSADDLRRRLEKARSPETGAEVSSDTVETAEKGLTREESDSCQQLFVELL